MCHRHRTQYTVAEYVAPWFSFRHLREERSTAATRVVEVRRGGTAPTERRAARATHAALAQTWFVHADFVDSEGEPGSFDTITCLR